MFKVWVHDFSSMNNEQLFQKETVFRFRIAEQQA